MERNAVLAPISEDEGTVNPIYDRPKLVWGVGKTKEKFVLKENKSALKALGYEVVSLYLSGNGTETKVGFIKFAKEPDRVCIDRLYVDPCHEGRGIGRSLIYYVRSRYPDYDISLDTKDKTEFYNSIGFEIVKIYPNVGCIMNLSHKKRLPLLWIKPKRCQ